MDVRRFPSHLRVALAYLVLSLLWIAATDNIVVRHATDPATMATLATIKDICFVLITAALLFVERRHSDETVTKLNQMYQHMAALVESSSDAIIGKDRQGNITSWNQGATAQYGFTAAEARGRHGSIIIPGDREEEFRNVIERLERRERVASMETVRVRKDGTRIDVALTISPIEDESGRLIGFSTISRDVGKQRRALMETRSANEKLRAMIDASPLAIFGFDAESQVTIWNPAAEKIFGWNAIEVMGKPYPLVPEEEAGRFRGEFGDLMKGVSYAGVELRRQRKDGSTVEVSLTTAPLRDERGSVAGILGIAEDITERKRNQELTRNQQQKLLQADKMASLGILVSGIAHEINNPNNYILLNSKILSRVWNDVTPVLQSHLEAKGEFTVAGMPYSVARERIAQLVSATGEGAQRIQRIVESLKDFARKDSGELDQLVDLDRVIASALVIANNLIKRSTRNFAVNYAGDLPPIRGNAQQLEQVILNLVTNSCQALPGPDAPLTVSTCYRQETASVIVLVHDGGNGIRPENLPLIFDPFFTTKREQGGTGLGLSVSYSIVKNHGGDLKFESTPGKGTTVTLTLPAE